MKLHRATKILQGCFLAFLLATSCELLAVAPVGPGEYRVETDEDVSYVGSGFAIPSNAVATNRPGVFYPAGGPKNADEVVWRNVKLSDIASFTGRINYKSGETYYWKDAGCYNVVTNTEAGYVQCQLQSESGSQLHGFVVQYRQEGDDVKARITYAKYAYIMAGQELGCDLTVKGVHITVTNTLYSVGDYVRAIADLGFVLREDVDASAAPSEIVLASTDGTAPDEETYRYIPCLMSDTVTLCRNLRIRDIVGMSGEISQRDINNDSWKEVQGYCLTNIGSAVQLNLMFKWNTRRFGANIRFYQDGSDVKVCTYWAGHSYDSKELDAPFGSGIVGESLGITNVPGTTSIAVRNIKVRIRPSSRIVGNYEPCIMKEDGWVKIWPGVKLADTVFGPALMGGYSLGSVWNVVSNYLRTAKTYADQSYYQFYKSSTVELDSIRFLMQEQYGDVYAKVASARYNYNYHLGDNPGTADYKTAVTNIVDGRSSEHDRTFAICQLTADHPTKHRHTVTVGNGFDPGVSPIWLSDVKLALAPSTGCAMSFGYYVYGCGVIGVSGEGAVNLTADLPDNVGLDVDLGTAVIAAPRTVGGLVNVASGAALEFVLANGVRPALSATSFSMEPGAGIVVSAGGRVSDIPSGGETFKVVTGCNYEDYALEGVTCRVAGQLFCSARVIVDEDGDIAVTIKPKKGFVITVK